MNEINGRLARDPEWNRREQMARALMQRRMIISTGLTVPFIVPAILALLTFAT